jgi:hypothetical protein
MLSFRFSTHRVEGTRFFEELVEMLLAAVPEVGQGLGIIGCGEIKFGEDLALQLLSTILQVL